MPEVLTITFADSTSRVVETITATPNHPFYVRNTGFVPAGGLCIGKAIVTRAGPALIIKSIERHAQPEGFVVYNFEVGDDHTYFVGTVNGGSWVHNPVDCWQVHGVLPDWAEKGAHITYQGVELSVRPAAGGEIVFKPFFGGAGRTEEMAAQGAQQLLGNQRFVRKLLNRVTAGKSYVLQYTKSGGTGRSAELHFLEKALQRRLE